MPPLTDYETYALSLSAEEIKQRRIVIKGLITEECRRWDIDQEDVRDPETLRCLMFELVVLDGRMYEHRDSFSVSKNMDS